MSDNKTMLQELIINRLDKINAVPNEELGQHFLIDQTSIDELVASVHKDITVIEIGPGVGQLTEALARKAKKVVAIEIDSRYKLILTSVQQAYSNVEIIYEDALSTNWRKLIKEQGKQGVQIISSLPYQITEPFLHLISDLKIKDITLVIGQRLGRAIQAENESDPNFTQRTLLVQTFFKAEVLRAIPKQNFTPVPRTDSVIVRLTPKSEDDFANDVHSFIFRRLFLTSSYSPLVKNCIKEALIKHSKSEKLTQTQSRAIIEELKIDKSILEKPFEQLSNSELALLSSAIRKIK